MLLFVGFQYGLGFAIRNGVCMNGVAVEMVKDEEESVSLAGWDLEFPVWSENV